MACYGHSGAAQCWDAPTMPTAMITKPSTPRSKRVEQHSSRRGAIEWPGVLVVMGVEVINHAESTRRRNGGCCGTLGSRGSLTVFHGRPGAGGYELAGTHRRQRRRLAADPDAELCAGDCGRDSHFVVSASVLCATDRLSRSTPQPAPPPGAATSASAVSCLMAAGGRTPLHRRSIGTGSPASVRTTPRPTGCTCPGSSATSRVGQRGSAAEHGGLPHQIGHFPQFAWTRFNLRDVWFLLLYRRRAACRSIGCYSSLLRSLYWPAPVGGAANALARSKRDMSILRPGNRNTGKNSTSEKGPLGSACFRKELRGQTMGRKTRLFDDLDENWLDPRWRPVKPVDEAAAVDDRSRLGSDTDKTVLNRRQSLRQLKSRRVSAPSASPSRPLKKVRIGAPSRRHRLHCGRIVRFRGWCRRLP
jgi:hypothetical protein